MRFKVINGEVVLTKKDILSDIEEQMEFLQHSNLTETQDETLAVLFRDLEILAEVIAVEEKNEDNSYPFIGSAWERRKEYHK